MTWSGTSRGRMHVPALLADPAISAGEHGSDASTNQRKPASDGDSLAVCMSVHPESAATVFLPHCCHSSTTVLPPALLPQFYHRPFWQAPAFSDTILPQFSRISYTILPQFCRSATILQHFCHSSAAVLPLRDLARKKKSWRRRRRRRRRTVTGRGASQATPRRLLRHVTDYAAPAGEAGGEVSMAGRVL